MLIADVAGKGTSAALYMAELKGLMLSLSQIYESPRQLLIEVNRIISANLDSRSFITMTYAVIDLAAGSHDLRARRAHAAAVPAGTRRAVAGAQIPDPERHGARPAHRRRGREVLRAARGGARPLYAGDIIVLYTDGITEAMNADSDLFGDERLGRIVQEHGHLDSGELRERILREIEAFVGGADQHDDMTMVLMKVQHSARRPRGGVRA